MLDAPAQLLSLARPASPGVVARRVTRPSTPLADAALLTNSHGEPSMGAELRAELDTADSVDLLCAFVKWSGLRILEPELARARERGVPLRVITTTYVGATERGALDRLVRDYGAEVKRRVRRSTDQTPCQGVAVPPAHRVRHGVRRLLEPLPGGAAGRRGVERPALVRRHAGLDEQVRRDLRDVLEQLHVRVVRPGPGPRPARRRPCRGLWPQGHRPRDHLSSGMEVRPYPYQAEMLEQLEVERVVHDRHRNLVVAATGTGKTVIAALDYRALCRSMGATAVAVVRRAPQGDSAAVPADLPGGARRPHVRRAVRRRLPPRALAARLCLRPVTDGIRRHGHSVRRLRRGGHRRVPPRRGADVPTHP